MTNDTAEDIRQLLAAPKEALSASAVRVAVEAVLGTAALLTVSSYLALLIDGRIPVWFVWQRLGLAPWLARVELGLAGSFVDLSGKVAALGFFVFGMVAVSKVIVRRLRDDYTFDARSAWRYAAAHALPVLSIVALALSAMLAYAIAGVFAAYLSALPIVGGVVLGALLVPGAVSYTHLTLPTN